jgi:hypothetical protein
MTIFSGRPLLNQAKLVTILCLSCGFEGLRTTPRQSFNSNRPPDTLKRFGGIRGAVRFLTTGMDVKIKRGEFLIYGYQVEIVKL